MLVRFEEYPHLRHLSLALKHSSSDKGLTDPFGKAFSTAKEGTAVLVAFDAVTDELLPLVSIALSLSMETVRFVTDSAASSV